MTKSASLVPEQIQRRRILKLRQPLRHWLPAKSAVSSTAGCCAILALLTLLLYWKCLTKFFAMEDFLCISWIQNEGPRGVFASFYSDNEYGVYRPISIHLYYGLCRFFFGLNPLGYHAVSLSSHVLNVLLVFALGFVLTNNRWFAFLAATAYLSRLSHHVGVFWAAGINEVWMGLFYLTSVMSFVLFWKRQKKVFFFLSLLSFLLALGSKESAVTLPFVLLTCGLIFKKAFLKDLLKVYLPFFILLLGYLLLKFILLKPMVGQSYEIGLGIWVFRNLLSYVWFEFNFLYLVVLVVNELTNVSLLSYLQNKALLFSLFGIFLIGLGLLLHRFNGTLLRPRIRALSQTDKLGMAGLVLFLLSLIPALLLKNRIQQYYLYTPSIGFSLWIGWLLEKYLKRPAAAAVAVFMILSSILGSIMIENLPDGRTTTVARPFLEDLKQLVREEKNVATVHVKNANGFLYQVLWYGAAIDAFLDEQVQVVLDVQDPNFAPNQNVLTVIYVNGRLYKVK